MAASLTFLTPVGALLILGVAVPLAVLVAVRRRARRVRVTLGLSGTSAPGLLVALVALLATSALVGLAAAQPVVQQTRKHRVRTDAEVFIVFDVSRSMLARRSVGSSTRFERAKLAGRAIRASLPGVRVGIASMTDRVLPHLFPGTDEDVFAATVERSLGIERPPPRGGFLTNATSLSSLAAIRGRRFFAPFARIRLVVVLTDGESTPVATARLGTLFRQPPAIESIFVQFWGADEQVFTRGAPEPQYVADPSARSILDGLAESTRGSVYSEGDVNVATQKAREVIGSGPTVVQGESGSRTALAPYLAAAALLPAGLLLWRRDR